MSSIVRAAEVSAGGRPDASAARPGIDFPLHAPPIDAPSIDELPIDDLPEPLLRELRSDHAGELGAVWIYRGILAVARDPQLRDFAQHHMAAEADHLAFFVAQLPVRWHTRLAPFWRLAGWLLGAGPALFGPTAVYRTITAVESFVDHHYAVQIDMLAAHPGHGWLRERLQAFRDDELAHRDDAARRAQAALASTGPGAGAADGLDGDAGGHRSAPVVKPGLLARLWMQIVGHGSALGAQIARRI